MKKDKAKLAKVAAIAVAAAVLIPIVSVADAVTAYFKSACEAYAELHRIVVEAFSD